MAGVVYYAICYFFPPTGSLVSEAVFEVDAVEGTTNSDKASSEGAESVKKDKTTVYVSSV